LGQTGEIADGSGYVWRVRDLRETAVAVMLFTMLFTSALAALRQAKQARGNQNYEHPSRLA
jgi:putative membrane protein